MDALPQGLNLQRRAGFARRARHWHAGAPYVGTKFVNVEVLLKVFWQQLDDYLEPVLRKLTQFVPVELVEKIFQLFTVCFSELHKNGHAFPGLLNFLDRPRPIFGSKVFCHWSTNSHFFWPVVVQIFYRQWISRRILPHFPLRALQILYVGSVVPANVNHCACGSKVAL